MHEKEKELIDNIKGLEKDIQGHKKEIREREETIADKEKRIYDLKKKNQELEKFKFVLDYKIKELKRQIEPRENEIADMRKQVEEMDMELEQYHKSNSALDLMIGELRLKMDGMQKEINLQRDIIAEGAAYISRFRRDLSATAAANLDKHKDLKLCVRELYKTYVLEEGAPKAAGGGRAVGAVARVAASYTVGFALTNTAFSLASAPFVETVKALEPVSTAALARLRLGDRESCATYATLVPIVAGVALATGGGVADAGPNRGLALAAVLACNVCFSLRAVFAKELRRDAPACVEIKSSTRLQCARNRTYCAGLFGCASRTR